MGEMPATEIAGERAQRKLQGDVAGVRQYSLRHPHEGKEVLSYLDLYFRAAPAPRARPENALQGGANYFEHALETAGIGSGILLNCTTP